MKKILIFLIGIAITSSAFCFEIDFQNRYSVQSASLVNAAGELRVAQKNLEELRSAWVKSDNLIIATQVLISSLQSNISTSLLLMNVDQKNLQADIARLINYSGELRESELRLEGYNNSMFSRKDIIALEKDIARSYSDRIISILSILIDTKK